MNLKTDHEIDLMRDNGRILARIMKRVIHQAKPGVSTLQLAEIASTEMERHGCVSAFLGYKGFPGILCVSLNHELVHGVPSQHVILKEKDLVKIDIGIAKNGFHADMAETFYIGDPPDSVASLIETTRKALNVGICNAIPGGALRKISQSIEALVTDAGYKIVKRYTGHGIGRMLHEKPPVPNYSVENINLDLLPGMVLAIEPVVSSGVFDVIVNDDGWTAAASNCALSAHFEHTVAITDNGPEVLTRLED